MKTQHISFYIVILLLFTLALQSQAVEGVLEIDDSYLNGSASGMVTGGVFTEEGWKTVNYTDNIRYDIRTAAWGKVEFDVTGIYDSNSVFPNVTVNKDGTLKDDVHYTLFTSLDRDDDESWIGQWMPSGVRQWHNPYKMVAHLFGYVEGDVWKWKHGRFRLNVAAFDGGYDDDPHAFEIEYGPIEWQGSHTYHVVLEWGQGVCNYFIDDSLIVSCDYSGFGEEYAPPEHSLLVGSAWNNTGFSMQTPINITYSNFKFWRYEDVTPPTVQAFNPGENETDVDLGAFISVLFDETLDTQSALDAISMSPSVSGEWKVAGKEIFYELNELLSPNTTYTVNVSTVLSDFSGNTIPSPLSFSFTTGEAVPNQVGYYKVFDLPLMAPNLSVSNRYLDVDLTGTFIGPSGQTIEIGGFWDGSNIYRVRMAPTEVGTWTYTVTSNIADLNTSGSFECIPSDSKGFIQRSETHPYTFELTDGTPWLWKGDTSWRGTTSSIGYESRWKEIIDLRAEQGYNMMQSILVSYINGDAFWQNEGGHVFELLYDGKNYDNINPGYFQWVDRRIEYARTKGIIPVLFFSWAQEYVKFTRAQWEAYEKYLVRRFAAYDVIWVICGEYNETYELGVTQADWIHHGQIVHAEDPYNHPISLHPSGRKSSAEFGYEDWFGFVMEQTGVDMYQKATNDRIFNKPVVNGEYAYAGYHESDSLRIGVWTIYTAGAFSTAGFFNTFAPDKGGWDPYSYQDEQNWLKWAYEFMGNIEWWKMEPRRDLVTNSAYCIADPGNSYLVFSRPGGSTTVNLADVQGEIKTRFFNPKTGEYFPVQMVNGGGSHTFTAPFEGDFVLYLGDYMADDTIPPAAPTGLDVTRP